MFSKILNGKPSRFSGSRRFSLFDRRPRGDAPATCMGIIIGIICLGIFGYYYFLHNRELDNAGKDIVVLNKVEPASFNAYRLRIRDKIAPMANSTGRQCRKTLYPIVRGKITERSEEVDKDLTKIDELLREGIGEINGQACPKQYTDMHRKLAKSYGYNWEALKLCRKSFKEEDKRLRKKMLEQASKALANGRRDCTSAQAACDRMFK